MLNGGLTNEWAQQGRPRGGWWRAGTEGNGKLRKARAKQSLLARSKMQAEEGAANCEGQSIGKRKVPTLSLPLLRVECVYFSLKECYW